MAEYLITPESHYQAVWIAQRKMRRFLCSIVLLLLLISLAGSLAKGSLDIASLVPLVLIFALLFVGLPVVQRWQIRRIHSQQKSLQNPISLEVDEDGISWTASNGNARIAWSDLYRWKGDDKMTLLYESQCLMRIVPHSALADSELSVLQSKLKTIRRG